MTKIEMDFYETMMWTIRDILQELKNLNENIEHLNIKEQKDNE